MECHACQSSERVEECHLCMRAFCVLHRGRTDAGVACAACLRAEAERKARVEARRDRHSEGGPRAAAAAPLPPAPLAPLPEPAGWRPLVAGLALGVPSGGYLYWLGNYLVENHAQPLWCAPLLGLLGGGFACAGMWAIVKTRLRS